MLIRPDSTTSDTARNMSTYAAAARAAQVADAACDAARKLSEKATAQREAGTRIKRKTLGFSIGTFGVDFTTESLEVPPQEPRPQQQAQQQASCFSQTLASAVESMETLRKMTRRPPASEANSSTLAQKQGHKVYARANQPARDEQAAPMFSGTV